MAATCGAQMPGGVDDELGLDRSGLGLDVRHRPPLGEPEAGHAAAGPDANAERLGGGGHGVGRRVRVEIAVLLHPDPAVERLAGDGGESAPRLGGRDDHGVEPDAASAAGGPLELGQLLGARCQPDAADTREDAQPLVELDALAPEPHHRRATG